VTPFEVIDLARKGNKYMQDKEPWKNTSAIEKRKGLARMQNCSSRLIIASTFAFNSSNLAILINPSPFHSIKNDSYDEGGRKMLEWENAGKIKLLSVGYSLRAPKLFRKIEDAEITQVEKLKSGLVKQPTEQLEQQDTIQEKLN
jgi:methionyl-tRNA synthetase